mgnify:CR=1 FL=1
MLLKKLTLNNFKTYYGHQEINFYIPKSVREEEQKNIILIGGLNGSGKTTLLKAILYVLFGKRGISESEHRRIFSNVINNTYFDEGGRECSLTLVLETDLGEEWELKTKWIFDHNKRNVHESREVTVRRPGSKVGKHTRVTNIEAYNRFIDRMIPYHAAPFFIFDGEEIKDIILRQNSVEMKEAIHKISGLEAYKLLLEDLRSVQLSYEQKLAKSVGLQQLNTTKDKLDKIEQEINELEERKRELLSEKKRIESLIQEAKESRNQKLVLNSKSREKIVIKQTQCQMELDNAIKQLQEYYTTHVVEIILAEQIQRLKDRLEIEKKYSINKQVYESALIPYKKFIDRLLYESIDPPLSQSQIDQLRKIGEDIWIKENNIKVRNLDEITVLHDLNNQDYTYLMNLQSIDKNIVIKMINRIEALRIQLAEIENELRNAPEAVDISRENNIIDVYTKDLGKIDLRFKSVNSKLNKLLDERRNLLNKLTRASDSSEDYQELQRQHEFTLRLIKAMEEYIEKMTMLKTQFIHDEFATMLTKLFRKQEEFGKIEFDINTYTIRLYNDRGQEISIHDRSAGEMQMIASALIWALTKASDLSLPMVIDTPLGRLDSYHRSQLINYYYKELSEQVIILSTDTEVTQEYVDLMKKHSYKQYLLDYDQNKKYTIIREGYFDFLGV